MLIEESPKVAAICVNCSGIWENDSTVCHFIPSKIENLPTNLGLALLLIENKKALSWLITVNSGEPLL